MAEDTQIREELHTLLDVEDELVALRIKISKDKLKLFLDGRRKEETSTQLITKKLLAGLIEPKLPNVHIDGAVLDDIARQLNQTKEVDYRRIAKGTAPIDGQDGKLVLLAKKYEGLNKGDEEGGDIRNRHLFDNIRQGAHVARIIAPTAGTPGVDVLGNPLPPKPGKEAKVLFDNTIAEEPGKDGSQRNLIAKISGYLGEQSGRLRISDMLTIDGDLDLSIGNLDFVGNICVRGNVMKDFEASADGTIEVVGDVIGGYLLSREKTVTIRGTVIGTLSEETVAGADLKHTSTGPRRTALGKKNILARDKLHALRLHGATVETGDNVEIMTEAMNSAVYCGGSLLLPQGQILGGNIFVRCGVNASIIGSSRGSKTVIHLVPNQRFGVGAMELSKSIRVHSEALEFLKLQLGHYVDQPEDMAQLPEPRRTKLTALYNRLREITASLSRLQEEEAKFAAAAQEGRSYQVVFLHKCFPGVEVHAEGTVFMIENVIDGPKAIEYLPATKEFRVNEYRPQVKDQKNESKKEPPAT